MKRITIKDLADLLQISVSTVSRALSNHPDISDAVKKKRVKEVQRLLIIFRMILPLILEKKKKNLLK